MAEQKKGGHLKNLTNGLLKENPVLRLVLGTCPTMAVTTLAVNGLGMGIAATVVLIGSNLVISLLRNFIPKQVRIPAYITVIAGFVTMVQLIVKAFAPDLDKALGIYLPLITTNCAVLGVTMLNVDNKYGFWESVVNGIGAGVGFMLALVLFAGVRRKLESCDVPKAFRGLPITLVAASLVSLSFMGFAGLAENMFK